MSMLANSLWSVACLNLETGSDTVKFYEGGRAIIAYPDGSVTKGAWSEAPDGHFLFHPGITNIHSADSQIYRGVINEEVGYGECLERDNKLCDFIMKRES